MTSSKSEQYKMVRVGLLLFGIGFGILLVASFIMVPLGWASAYGLQSVTILLGLAGGLLGVTLGFLACLIAPSSREKIPLLLGGGCVTIFTLVAILYWIQTAPMMYSAQGRPPNTFFVKVAAPILFYCALIGGPLCFAVYCRMVGHAVGGSTLKKFALATIIVYLISISICIAFAIGMTLYFRANGNHFPHGDYGYDEIVVGFQLLGIANLAMFLALSVIGAYETTPSVLTKVDQNE